MPYSNQKKLPAIKVKNCVIWKSTQIDLPFDIHIGRQSELGLLLSLDTSMAENEASFMLGVREGHNRSSDIGEYYVYDKRGNLYRDIDLKGTGWVGLRCESGKSIYGVFEVSQWQYWSHESSRMMGLLDERFVKRDISFSERFAKWGIRTYCPVAVIRLKELNYGKELYSIEEIKAASSNGRFTQNQAGFLPNDFYPVIMIRAFGVKNRLNGISKIEDILIKEDIARERVNDAISFLRRELKKEKIDVPEYMHWFASTLGKNIGIMHHHKCLHSFLTQDNITLDCRIVDLDSVQMTNEVKKGELEKLIELDTTGENSYDGINRGCGALDSLRLFFQRMKTLYEEELSRIQIKELEKEYWGSYKKNNSV